MAELEAEIERLTHQYRAGIGNLTDAELDGIADRRRLALREAEEVRRGITGLKG